MSYARDPVAAIAPFVQRTVPVRVAPHLARRLRMGADAYQLQRAGERGDYTAAPGYTPVSPEKSIDAMIASVEWGRPIGTEPIDPRPWLLGGAGVLLALVVWRGLRRR